MQDFGTERHDPANTTSLACHIRCRTPHDLEYHLQRNHTAEGLGRKLHSETQMARFFEQHNIAYERDTANRVDFRSCPTIQVEGGRSYSRPDFFLPEYSTRLHALVIVCNDEFAHRRYTCEFQRIFNTVNALCARDNQAGTRVLFIRVNPHFHHVGTKMYDMPLAETHAQVRSLLERLQPSDLFEGVSLAYIGYDRNEDGTLCLFDKDSGNDDVPMDDRYVDLYRDCIIHVG
jgi:hypothetical protein